MGILIVFTHINFYSIQICGFGNYFNDLTLPTNLFLAHLTQSSLDSLNVNRFENLRQN